METEHIIMTENEYNSLELLTANIAHEIKNPLQVMRTSLDFLQHTVDKKTKNADIVFAEMHRAVNAADRIVMELLELTRPGGLDKTAHALNALVGNTLWLMKREMCEKNIHWKAQLGPDVGLLRLNKKSISFALIQLIRHAEDQTNIAGEKQLSIVTRKCRIEKNIHRASFHEIGHAGGESAAVLELLCSRPDIDDYVMLRMFDHVQGHEDAHQHDQLAAVHEIMRMHNGFARIQVIPETCTMAQLVFRDLYPEMNG